MQSRDSSVSIVIRLRTGWPGFDYRQGQGPSFATPYWPALWPTQSPNQGVPWGCFPGVKRPDHEADHSPPSSVEVKIACNYGSTPLYDFMALYLVMGSAKTENSYMRSCQGSNVIRRTKLIRNCASFMSSGIMWQWNYHVSYIRMIYINGSQSVVRA